VTEWLNANYLHLVAIAVGFAFRWGATQFLANATKAGKGGGGNAAPKSGKWNKARIIKFIALVFYIVAGLLFAYGALPLAQWLVGWGEGAGSWLSVIFGVITIAAGWHALHGLVGLVHDMTDGTPDDEAFKAAFMVPTTIPLGWAALVGLFTNPRGVASGVAVVAVSIVTAIYAHKILKKAHAAQGHYRLWMYFATVICAFVGFAHIPALAYLNDAAGSYLPEWAGWMLRLGLVAAAAIFLMIGVGDLLRDWIPEKWSQWAAMYSIPVFTVLAVSWATLQSNAETSLNTVFGAFS
jgi:succinate dehydrogenase hydrophobic anchor subunit